MELQQALQALRNADAAGDVEAARRLAQVVQQLSSATSGPAPQPKGGFGPAMQAGWAGLKGDIAALAGRTGMVSPEEAEQVRANLAAEAAAKFKPTEKSWLEAPIQKTLETAGGSLPYMAAPVLAGGAASLAGAPALAATGLAGLASAAQFTGSNLSRQVQEGTPLAQTNLGAAAAAAVPQAALDIVGFEFMPGIRNIFRAAGREIPEAAAHQIAKQSIGQIAKDYALSTGKAMGVEGLTEAGQQVLERMQAGLNITDPQARQEYLDNFIGGAVLGGVISPAGRFHERGILQDQQRQQEALQRQQAAQTAQEQAAQAAQAQAARYQDPAYAQQVAQDYMTAEARFRELRDAAKVAKDAPMADKLAAQQAREDLKAFVESTLKPAAVEYNRVKPLLAQIPAPEAAAEPVVPGAAPAQAELFGQAPAAAPAAAPAEMSPEELAATHGDYRRKLANLSDALETQRNNVAVAAQAGDTQIAQEEAGKFRQIEQAIKDMQAAQQKLPPEPKAPPTGDVLDKALADAKKKLQRAGEEGDVDAIERLTRKIMDLQQQQPGLFTKASQDITAALDRQTAEEIAAGREAAQAQRAGVEQEVAGIRGLGEKEPGYAAEARKERQAQLEVEGMERGRMDTGVTEQGVLFPEETGAGVQPAAETALAKRQTLVMQLQAARRAGDRKAADVALEQLRALKEAPVVAPARGAVTAPMAEELAGTRMPEELPPSAAGVPVERKLTPEGTSEQAVQTALDAAAQQPNVAPEDRQVLEQVGANLKAVAASPERRADVARLAHQVRIGQDTTEARAKVQQHLALLEEGARAAEEKQRELFRDTEVQGVIFDTPAEFQQYLVSDALQDTRKAVGLSLQTLARAMKEVAPLQARAAELRESLANLQQLMAATKRTGAEKISAAEEAHGKAVARIREQERALDEKMRPAQAAVVAASLELSKAQAARAKVLDSIAKNQAKFSPEAAVQKSADAMAAAQHRYKDALAHGGNTAEYLSGLAAAAKDAEAKHRATLARSTNPLDRSVLSYLNKDLELQLRLADAEQTLAGARTQMDGARAALDAVEKEVKGAVMAQAETRVTKRAEAHARGVVTKARGATEATLAKQRAEIEARDTERQQLEKQVKERLAPIEAAQRLREAPAAEETAAQRAARDAAARKKEQAQRERLAAIPGRQVSYEDFRKGLDKLEKFPERIRELDAKAKDETLSEAVRKKAKYDARRARAEAQAFFDSASGDPERVANARETISNEITALKTKIEEKKVSIGETGKAKSTIASRRKELSEMQSKLREWQKLQKQLEQRAKITPILTPEERAARATEEEGYRAFERGMELEAEGTTGRLPARRIGPVVKRVVQAGNIRTGELGTIAERKAGLRNKPVQAGAPRGVTATQAVRQATKDTAREQAMLEMSRIDDLHEKAEAALEKAEEEGNKPLIAKYQGYLERLELARVKAEKTLFAPSAVRTTRASTPFDLATRTVAERGDVRTVLQYLAGDGSTQAVRELATKLLPLTTNVRFRVNKDVKYEGKSVAGLYDPKMNAVTMHPDGLTEEDVLHELVHAATDTALLADPSTLSAEQRAARAELERMQRTVAAHPNFKTEHIGNVREFAAEVMTNPGIQAKMAALGRPVSLWTRFVNAVKRLLGFKPDGGPGARAQELVEALMSRSREIAGPATAAPSATRTSAAAELAGSIIATPMPFKERIGKNLGLSAEMWGVDMRAPLVKALGAAGEKAAVQAAYYVRKADARMSHTYAALDSGPLQLKKDSKGYHTIEAGNGPSGKAIFEAVSKIPGANAQDKMNLAQVYLTAKRAERVGWDKLGFDPSRVDALRTQADAMMAEINADPATRDALAEVSRLYNEYNKGLISFLAESGAIPRKEAAELLKHGDYVPFYRLQGNGVAELVLSEKNVYPVGNIRNQPYLRELKGGDQKLLPLNEALIRNTMLLTDMGLRNLATKDVAYALQSIGQPAGTMRIRKGPGEATPNTVRFKQEPDPSDPHDRGERHLIIDTAGTAVEDIPSDMLAQSMDGSFAALPAFLKVGGWFGDILRAGVTRNPMYVARQLLRDPMAASFTAGLDSGPLTAVAKSVNEFAKQMTGRSDTAAELIRKGVVHSNIFTGDVDDMAKFGLQLSKGDQSAYHKFLAFWDNAAMRADAATRAQMYDSAIKQGRSEMEAEMAAMEMMNFNKRGISPTVQYASRLIPFFNAQIQGLNVLYKAATGQMPLNDRLRIKEKFFRRAMMLAGFTLLYSAAMDDDDTYKNAKARDRYGYFFLPNPLGGEHFKLPIPFEVGVLFKALPEAMLDVMKDKAGPQEWQAVKQLLVQQIPGGTTYGVPQMARPTLEVMSNADWYTGREIESAADKRLLPQERFTMRTSELAKTVSNVLAEQPIGALQLSPKQIEHLANGYLGSLPIAVARLTNAVFASEETNPTTPEMKGSDLPVFGAMFQKEYGGGPVEAAYAQAQAIEQAANTYKKMLTEGRVAQAKEFRDNATTVIASPQLATRFTKQMQNFKQAELAIRRTEKDPERMRARLDMLDKQRNEFAKMYLQAVSSLAK